MELNKNKFPVVCSGCSENCYTCEKRFRGIRVSEHLTLAAKRIMKEKAIVRLFHEIEMIDDALSQYMV